MVEGSTLVDLSSVKTWLGITTDDYDSFLNLAIENVSDMVKEYCHRPFSSVTRSEVIDIENEYTSRIGLKYAPVTSVVALTCAGSLVDPSDYVVDSSGEIKLKSGNYFTKGVAKVEVTYVAGLTQVPNTIKWACYELIGAAFNSRGKGGLISEKIGDYSYKLPSIEEDQFVRVRQRLDQYRLNIT